MKKTFLLRVFFLFSVAASSQNYVDILKLHANTTNLNAFDSSLCKTRVNELVADLTLPVKLGEKTSLLTGAVYEGFQARLFSDGPVKSFGSFTTKVGINQKFGERWSGTFVALPKISSDFVSLGNKDFQLGGITIIKYKMHESLHYKFGLYYNNELFGPFFVPMAGLYYLSPAKEVEANLMLPLQADVSYTPLPMMSLGCNFNGQIRSYHLTNSLPGHHSTYLARSTNELFVYLKYNLSPSLSIQAKVGRSIGRSFRVYDEDDKVTFGLPATFIGSKRKQLNSDFSDGLVFQLSFLYRFQLNKK